MASASDGEGELDATFSCMEQPPLIKQLRQILSEYPDNGQIIKELLQNAEDARASEVEIIYDERCINQEVIQNKQYRKFFRGPALCVKNNSVFKAEDWKGIKMVASSVKEDNKMKVGQFGLGFKSVFHMTDYPCIMSGDQILLVDPTMPSDKVNAEMKLKDLQRYRGMDVEAFFTAFRDTVGISEASISQGHYSGTVFWFPLRSEVSQISSTIYNQEKIKDLFSSFQKDSSEVLLFLCHLESVNVFRKGGDGLVQKVAAAEINGARVNVRQKRKAFVGSIERSIESGQYPSHDPILCSYEMIIRTTNQNGHAEDIHWMIVHYFMGNNSSPKLQNLVQNPDLKHNPQVGVAMPLSQWETFEGHVFCFLPLPREGSRLTGLPVHINGFFSLSQNRHHLKWATNDQLSVTDNNILWNQILIDECIPEVYKELFKVLLEKSREVGNKTESVETVYEAVPYETNVLDKWKRIPDRLRTSLCQLPFLYSPSSRKCVTMKEALFAMLKNLPSTIQHCEADIISTISQMNVAYVPSSPDTFKKLAYYYGNSLKDLTPNILADLLRQNTGILSQLERSEKISVLSYLLSANEPRCLKGLPLLPLVSRTWGTFGQGETVYVCGSKDEVELFPEYQEKMVCQPDELKDQPWTQLRQMASQGNFQLKTFDMSSFKTLLINSITSHLGSLSKITDHTKLSWLQKVWNYIVVNYLDITELESISLIPQLVSGSWAYIGEIQLHPFSHLFLKKGDIPPTVCECLGRLGVTILPDLPSWFRETTVHKYLHTNTKNSIEKLLKKIWNRPERPSNVKGFNQNTSSQERQAFLCYMSRFSGLDSSSLKILHILQLFNEGSSQHESKRYASVQENPSFVRTTLDIPVRFTKPFIIAKENEIQLLSSLGAREMHRPSLVEMILKEMRNRRNYKPDECETFMMYFLMNMGDFHHSQTLLNLAREVHFLRTDSRYLRPQDLFDPEDNLLQNLFLKQRDKFPLATRNMGEGCRFALRQLGLKGTSQITAQDIAESADLIHTWSNDYNRYSDGCKVSKAVLAVLHGNPSLSQTMHHYNSLLEYLKQLSFVCCVQEKPTNLPSSFPWYSKTYFCKPCEARARSHESVFLVGATMPIVEPMDDRLSDDFGWKSSPPVDKVIEQLVLVKQCYRVEEKANWLPVINQVYKFLTSTTLNVYHMSQLTSQDLVWTGNGFEKPENVTVTLNIRDIQNLAPYCFTIPPEFVPFGPLFKKIGCHPNQTVDVLKDVIKKIESKHQTRQSNAEYDDDCEVVQKIIDKLAERRNELAGEDVMLPVQTLKQNQLVFMSASKCTADKNSSRYVQEEGDDSIMFVSDLVSLEVAKALGAKPLNKQILSGTESMGIEGFGQTEKLTDRIRKLIGESYTDGLSVPKELIQNADDAGATVVKFLYDERHHEDARTLLLSKEMADSQGPSLFVYNNATFSDADFSNIKKLNGATKEMNEDKIGRFGLGFCAVYNLTDVPSFISRSTIVIFDPQKAYLTDALEDNSPGIKIDFRKPQNKKLLRLHEDQFKPFQNLFNCNVAELAQNGFNGTLFRFPLRTPNRARNSEISKVPYNRQEVHELLSMFVKNAGNMLLFTQNVVRIELHSIPSDAKSVADQVMLFSTEKENRIPSPLSNQSTVLQRVSSNLAQNLHFNETEEYKIKLQVTNDGVTFFKKDSFEKQQIDSSWRVVWEVGKAESLQMSKQMSGKRALPLSAVAVQCEPTFKRPLFYSEQSNGFYTTGHMFCFLPLPIQTKLPIHINGSFDVTSDRRRLVTLTDDDKNSRKNKWNEFLLSDAAVNAMFTILQQFTGTYNCSYKFYDLWPLDCLPVASSFQESFFRRVVAEDLPLFHAQRGYAKFSEIVFLDKEIRLHPEIGDISFDMMVNIGNSRGKLLVDLPEQIIECLCKYYKELVSQTVIRETEFLDWFLLNISHRYWIGRIKERNRLLRYAIKSSKDEIKSKLKELHCIPVETNGSLKRPCDLVHKEGNVAPMYDREDEVFIHADLESTDVLDELCKLGMVKHILPLHSLTNRFETIEKLAAERCTRCALKRCQLLLQYLNRWTYHEQNGQQKDFLESISHVHTLPVMRKPEGWMFSWNADNDKSVKTFHSKLCQNHSPNGEFVMTLASSASLSIQKLYDVGGTVVNVVDEELLNKGGYIYPGVYKLLKVNCYLPTSFIVQHISTLTGEYDLSEEQYKQMYGIFNESYHVLNERMVTNCPNTSADLGTLHCKPVVLVGKRLFTPMQVAFSIRYECVPYLIQLPVDYASKYEKLFLTLGVKQTFLAEDFIGVLRRKKEQWGEQKCEEVDIIVCLLRNVVNCEDLEILRENKEYIVAPDTRCHLYPMDELVLGDEEFETDVAMHFLHESIPPQIGKKLGAKQKQMKCFEDISIGIPFGQKEKLVSRLQNLINAYPCDSSIMKELLQNADDANASEINFIKDYRNHSTERIFAESCSSLQGPSLCVYNDSYFTEDDLQGIHDLGEGSKRQDPTKTGQYGVGFNSVYHLTDTPSFMTKGPGLHEEGLLVIFDPTCKHLPNVKDDEPGIKCNVRNLQVNFPGVLEGFNMGSSLFKEQKGTLFRFPFRNEESKISKYTPSSKSMDGILAKMKQDMCDWLLFVKNVESITISDVSTGELTNEYSVWTYVSETDKDKRARFFDDIKRICREFKENKSKLLTAEMREVSYQMRIRDSEGRDDTYFVVQRFGFEDPASIPETITQYFKDELIGCLPLGGVAHRISGHAIESMIVSETPRSDTNAPDVKHTRAHTVSERVCHYSELSTNEQQYVSTNKYLNRSSEKCKVFCFLPLPVTTDLPVHLNGHFALDEARRDLVKDGYRKEWNDYLIQHIVVPSYIQCMKQWQLSISRSFIQVKTWNAAHGLSSIYHSIFPLVKDVWGPYWKGLVNNIYKSLVTSNHCLFPVISNVYCNDTCKNETTDARKETFQCEWVSMGLKGDTEKGHFNTLMEGHLLDWEKIQMRTVEALLKDFGLKVINSPYSIRKAIEECEVGTPACSSPDEVVAFITASKSTNYTNIGQIGSQISKTKIRNVQNLTFLLRFLAHSKAFVSNLENMPLLLSNGNTLKHFSKEQKLYCSKFAWMFPDAAEDFVHCDLVPYYPYKDLLKKGFVQDVSVDSFIELIPSQYKQHLYDQQPFMLWDKTSNKKIPNEKWISWFWKFVCEKIREETSDGNNLKGITNRFSGWAFLPATRDKDHYLLQMNKAFLIVQKYSFIGKKDVMESVYKFEPFMLDRKVFETETKPIVDNIKIDPFKLNTSVFQTDKLVSDHKGKPRGDDIIQMISCITTSETEPDRLLEFLLFQTQPSRWSSFAQKIDRNHADCILKYFNSQLEDARFKEYPQVTEKLITLPLFATLSDTLVSLNCGSGIFVIPSGMPVVGLDILSAELGVIFLKENKSLCDLYKFLRLSDMTDTKLYGDIMLPNMTIVPRRYWLEHVIYVRDHVIKYGYAAEKDLEQVKLVECLSCMKFIETRYGYRTSAEFYNFDDPKFRILCDDDELLPETLQNEEWEPFLIALGLHHKMTDKSLIHFAQRIEQRQDHEKSIQMSKILTSHFKSELSKLAELTLSTLSRIRFILPVDLKTFQKSIVPLSNENSGFICLARSVERRHVDICWSTLPVLSINIDKKYHSILCIHSEPPMAEVFKHCQNVSVAFTKNHLRTKEDGVKQLMHQLYTFIKGKAESPLAQTMLQRIPIVHLPDEKKMVTVNDVVMEIASTDVVKPYLYKAPVEYGQFFKLFTSLGMSSEVKCYHYQNILTTIKSNVQDNDLSITELEAVRCALSGLYRYLKKKTTGDSMKDKLYLPSVEKKMFVSTELVIVNNQYVYHRMSNHRNMNYFLGFDLKHDEEFVELLPKELRPRLLTQEVKEEFDEENIRPMPNSRNAMKIESFIQSEEFLKGICRIVKGTNAHGNSEPDAGKDVNFIKQCLLQIKVFEVSRLETYLIYKGEIVPDSYRTKVCFTDWQTGNGGIHFYFNMSRERNSTDITGLMCRSNGLSHVILKYLDISLQTSDLFTFAFIMRHVDDPTQISKILDEQNYPQFDSNIEFGSYFSSAFPIPGTYVEEKFLPFLEQTLDTFDKSEFRCVAMELEDMELDTDEDSETVERPMYIYVHIFEEVKSQGEHISVILIKYLVNVGTEDFEEVPGYRLFRFVRPHTPTDEITVYNRTTPQLFLPFDENCNRIKQILQDAWTLPEKERRRIVRRLLFQWHPDKNRGSEEYAEKMFKFIQQCVGKLEQHGCIDDDDVDGNANDFSRSSFHTMYNNVNRRAQSYARAYHDNLDDYNRTHNSGNYNHRNAYRSEVKDISEARRWMRQAKCDFLAAKEFLPDADDHKAYNWICYMSHQASEKALKAACYAKNANAVSLQNHSLTEPASALSSPLLINLASEMESHVGVHTRMRYPNSVNRPNIPADIFTKADAERAVDIAKNIIENTSDHI